MEKSMLLVYNPISGRSQIKEALSDILAIMTKSNYRITVHPTSGKNDCFEYFSENACKYDVISVCGGDGMLSETVNALMLLHPEKRPPVAYFPTGSTNDFAASVNLPTDLRLCAKRITEGVPFPCDAGLFGEKYFAYIAAFGAFTSVSYDTPQDMKNTFGHFAYVVEGIRSLSAIKSNHIRVSYNGDTIEDNFIYGMVTNTLQVGGVLKARKSESICLNDGLFEVLLVKESKRAADLQAILSGVVTQNFSSRQFISFTADEVTFESDVPIPWTLDGEYGGAKEKITISNIPHAFSVIV